MKEVMGWCLDFHLTQEYIACKDGDTATEKYHSDMARYYERELALLK